MQLSIGHLDIEIWVNVIFFLYLMIREINYLSVKYCKVQKAAIAILGIATTQYFITGLLVRDDLGHKATETFAQQLRYVDWLITTPLLLYTYWALAEANGYQRSFYYLLVPVVLMIVLGFFSELPGPNWHVYYTLSTIAYLYIVYEIFLIREALPDDKQLLKDMSYFFIIGWAVYPVAFFMPFRAKYSLYSIGDFVNKGIYSLVLYQAINQEITETSSEQFASVAPPTKEEEETNDYILEQSMKNRRAPLYLRVPPSGPGMLG